MCNCLIYLKKKKKKISLIVDLFLCVCELFNHKNTKILWKDRKVVIPCLFYGNEFMMNEKSDTVLLRKKYKAQPSFVAHIVSFSR